jgi:hypothetical protein
VRVQASVTDSTAADLSPTERKSAHRPAKRSGSSIKAALSVAVSLSRSFLCWIVESVAGEQRYSGERL